MFFATTISYCRRASWLLLFLILHQVVQARLSLFVNEQPVSLRGAAVQYYFDTSTQNNFQRFLAIRNQLVPVPPGNIDMSYKEGAFWIRIDLSSISPAAADFILIQNPHINLLNAWIVQHDTLLHSFTPSGDHLPFKSRQFYHPHFVFQLVPAYRQATLLLRVDKRNEQLNLPVYFFSENSFIKHNRENNIIIGLLTGIGFFILLFTLFLYLNMRERVYVYYALYVLVITFYILCDSGMSFLLFYPNTPVLPDLSRPFLISQAPIYYILFARCLLNADTHFPRLHRITNWFIGVFVLLFLLAFFVVPNSGSIRTFLLGLMMVVMFSSFLLVLVYSFLGIRHKIRYAGYVLAASVILAVFIHIYHAFLSGYVPDTLVTRHAVGIGFILEISLLAFALSIRFKFYKQEAEKLLRRLNQQQEAIFKNISEYQEKEMKRISNLLHDSVGASLSSIKYNLESVENSPGSNVHLLKTTIDDITELTDEIRNISHNLSPLLLQKKGLEKGLHDLISRYNRTGNVQVFLESIGSQHSTSFQNEILVYRIIQELLHNAIKHASANEILIQLMLEPELISIFIEDNGRGFEQENMQEGLGFAQIKGLVTFVNGRFAVDSQVNNGCRVSIEIPVIPHEWTNQRVAGGRPPYVFGRG